MKLDESGFRPPLCTYRLNWARRTSCGWWDDWDDTVLQTQDSKFEPWRSEAEHATSRSRRLPTILTFTRGWGRNIFCFFQTAETGNRTPTTGVKGSGANHYPRAPALHLGRRESIPFGTKHMLSKHSKLAISCGNNVITSKPIIMYLVVDLEQTLRGTAIVENILKKGNSRQAKYLNTRSRKLLTSALILCHFDYACSVWYSGLQTTMKHKLQILQNKTIRFALYLPSPGHIERCLSPCHPLGEADVRLLK